MCYNIISEKVVPARSLLDGRGNPASSCSTLPNKALLPQEKMVALVCVASEKIDPSLFVLTSSFLVNQKLRIVLQEQFTYEGGFLNGKMNGQGVLTYANGDCYRGDFLNGKMSGDGVLTYANGDCYRGGFLDGKRSGKGEVYYKNGDTFKGKFLNGVRVGAGIKKCVDGSGYDGQWEGNRMHGQGIRIYANGDRYEGSYVNNKKNGKGTMIYTNGDRYEGCFNKGVLSGRVIIRYHYRDIYEGEWENSQFHGQGKMTYAEGGSYEGDYLNGKRHGQGTRTYANGNLYKGEYNNNEKNGNGTMTYANGNLYKGEFQDGKMHGSGKLKYANNNVYEGQWENSQFHGQGKMTYANGNIYEGEFLKGKFHGQGKMTYAEGGSYEGEFIDGKYHGIGTMTDADGCSYEAHYKNNILDVSKITPSQRDRFWRMLVSDNELKGGFDEAITHQILSEELQNIPGAPTLPQSQTITKFLKSNSSLSESCEFDPCVLDVSRGEHAFLIKIKKSAEGGVHLVLIDSASFNNIDDSKKAQTCRTFELKKGVDPKAVLEDLNERDTQGELEIKDRDNVTKFLENKEKFIEREDLNPPKQRIQKIGNCSLKCWLSLLRYELHEKGDSNWLSQWHRLKVGLFKKAEQFFVSNDPEYCLQAVKGKIERRGKKGEGLGFGRMEFHSGDKYRGHMKDGKMHGYGELTFKNEDFYEGNFKDGKMHGTGEIIYCCGGFYNGEWKDGKRHGKGELFDSDSDCKYIGNFVDGMIQGQGKMTIAEGSQWMKGNFIDGKREGKFSVYNSYPEEFVSYVVYKNDKVTGFDHD